ncbi:MAG: putative exosortase B-associated extracellular polysaccharide biosynthesis transporter EpsL [Methylotenera sp.]|uniref:XrtB/PEP-CTERM-associated polysaccharide biosynthesis outer membrane protein EpsL n=1 Tax=Methylotenera sp. TaxID=2051956 RepID=UPI00180D38EA|nr:XrtB/PEP-CTERM-associated polysaccharide biosynthesis outer membrane protein EpsL [Methylotenera sp.]NOU25208.1 putative exosortase B-associated extracellular polysaccharide biosynthesis transporter EpsL [Methylotenera sp.]
MTTLNLRQMTRFTFVIVLLPTIFGGTSAFADENDTLNFIVGVSRQHDDNLFRRSSSEQSENITKAFAGIKLDKKYSLQQFKFDYTVTSYNYQSNNNLDFNAQDYKAAWLWTLTPSLKGTLSADRKQQLNDFQDYRNVTGVNGKNIRINQTQHFEADFSPHNIWHLLGGVTRTELKNSRIFNEEDDYTMNALDAGVKYVYRSGSAITLMGHQRKGDYDNRSPNPVFLYDSGFDETEGEAKLSWLLSGKSQLNLRTAYVSRDHDHFSKRDYSGAVGSVDYNWTPAGKLRVNVRLASDLSSYQTNDSSYTRNNVLSVSPAYAVTDKININANASLSRRSFLGSGINPSGDRTDNTQLLSVGVNWKPHRNVTLGANVQRTNRNSSVSLLDYTDTITGISGTLNF